MMPQTLILGSKGQDVILLQTKLNSHPPTALPLLLVDGDFGSITLQRVEEFQQKNGLQVDGVVGPITWAKLLSEDIPSSANSITTAEGGSRKDPEGYADAKNVKLITWKDSLNADRTMTLGAYLYQYDFSFNDGQQVVTRSANDDAFGHPGFGYVVSHNTQNGNSPLGKSQYFLFKS